MKKYAGFILAILLFSTAVKAEETKTLINEQSNLEFQVNGLTSVVMAAPGSVCDSTTEGSMYYDKAQHALVVCNGTAWTSGASSPMDSMTWHDVTNSRSSGTVYTNTSSHIKIVSISVSGSGQSSSILHVGSNIISQDSMLALGEVYTSAVVPPGATYWHQLVAGYVYKWMELY